MRLTMRIALGLEYDGRAFCGLQSQPDGCGVQDALERALAAIAGRAGRARSRPGAPTPACTRRRRSCISIADVERPDTAWVRGVNAQLPSTVGRAVGAAGRRRIPRALQRTRRHYTYLLLNRAERPGAARTAASAGTIGPLDVDAMRDGRATL